MIVYLDTSALVKLYVQEQASQDVREVTQQAESIVTSRVAYSEACAALAQRRHDRRLAFLEFRDALEVLSQQWLTFGSVEVDEYAAGEIAIKHTLRGFDAIHVAAALAVSAKVGKDTLIFSSFDSRQLEAAQGEGLKTTIVNDPTG